MAAVESVSVQFALLAVARSSAVSVPDELDAATQRATAAGHKIITDEIVADSETAIRGRLTELIANPEIDVVLVLAGAESDAASKALKPLVGEVLPGFTDLFRWLMFQEAGASAMLSSAEAAQCGTKFVFVLPGAIAAAMDKLILPQFDPKTTPRNLVDKLPRLRTEPGPREAVPQVIPIEKTQGGSGIHTRLPAIPSGRLRSRTGANVVHREMPTNDPTKPIDLEKLEQDLAASTPEESQAADDATRPLDLGAGHPDGYAPDREDDHTDVTLAAPPPPALFPKPAMTIPSIAKPPPRANPTGARGISPSTAPRPASPSTPPSRREFAMTPATPMPVTITPRRKAESAKPVEPAKPVEASRPVEAPKPVEPPRPLDAKTAAIEAQRAKDASASAEARKRALTPKPISVAPPKPTEWEQHPAPAPSKRDSGRHAAIVSPDPSVAAQAKLVEPAKYGDAARAPSPSLAAASGTTSRRETTEADVEPEPPTIRRAPEPAAEAPTSRRDPKPDGFDERPTVRVVPDVAAKPAKPAEPPRRESARPIKEPPLTKVNGAKVHPASDLDAAETVDGMPAAGSSTEAIEKIDQDDLIEAADDASPAEIRSVLMKDVAPPVKPGLARRPLSEAPPARRPITEPPPAPAKRPETTPPAATAPAKRSPTQPPPRASADELPRGNFAYPVQKRGMPLVVKLLLAAVILGAGFFAVVLIFNEKDEGKPATPVAATPPAPTEPAPAAVADAAVEIDAAIAEPDIEMDPVPMRPNEGKPKPKAGTTEPKPKPPKPPVTPPTTPTTPAAAPPDAAVAVVDDDCDETSCVLSKYDRACCAKYKPASTDFKPRIGDVPESLDKTMVRAGVERVKPRVVACGEKSSAKGTVRIALAVSPDGDITSASVADSPDVPLGECVLAAMKNAKFGKTVNGASFTYPFAF